MIESVPPFVISNFSLFTLSSNLKCLTTKKYHHLSYDSIWLLSFSIIKLTFLISLANIILKEVRNSFDLSGISEGLSFTWKGTRLSGVIVRSTIKKLTFKVTVHDFQFLLLISLLTVVVMKNLYQVVWDTFCKMA